jgi:hypothetical protein
MRVAFTLVSGNRKTGPIPVSTTSKETCPSVCPLSEGGCYAKYGPLGMFWNKVEKGLAGMDWHSFIAKVKALPKGQLWRHNQAGDLPGIDNDIDVTMLQELVEANRGRRGFTYTHKPVLDNAKNAEAIKYANANGFTINLSSNNLAHADELKALGIAPVVTLLEEGVTKAVTPAGNKVVVCPAQTRDLSCAQCKLCSYQSRNIVGFWVHGTGKKKASVVATQVSGKVLSLV